MAVAEVWSVDTEWGFRDGRIESESAWEPVVLCLVGLRTGRRHSFWGRDPRLPAFFRDRAGDLFVAHFAVAEMKYLLRLNVPLPARWFDTFVGWRRLTNRPRHLEAGLSAALHRLGLPHLAPAVKDELRQRILRLEFGPDSPEDRRTIADYCFSDCAGAAELYRWLVGRIDPVAMDCWAEYLKAVARMELRGIAVDVRTARLILRSREALRTTLIERVNHTWPVFKNGSFRRKAFLAWCRQERIDWPRKPSPTNGRLYLPLDDETLADMEGRHSFIGRVRQVRKTLQLFGRRSIKVDGRTGRHYYSTSPFRSVTGRNAPRNFIFSGPKWQRWLIVPPTPDHVLVYVDYIAQEVGIAAALSDDSELQATYKAADCHMEFAIRAGAAPPGATKKTHPSVRRRYKTVNLGVLYGQTAFGIATRLGIPLEDAQAILDQHHALFPVFWGWSERAVQGAFDRGEMSTPCGWGSRVPPGSNERTWMNFPVQATGSDIMRLTICYLDRQRVSVLAPVHDGFLLCCRRDQLPDLRQAVDYACGTAVAQVLLDFPLRWEFTVYDRGRFEDEDGRPLWEQIRAVLLEFYPHATHLR
jgi:hypothetical protein